MAKWVFLGFLGFWVFERTQCVLKCSLINEGKMLILCVCGVCVTEVRCNRLHDLV